MSLSKVKAIIHGHFYQPPREDPWTDYIEEQPSAYPDKNWNIRITNECYAPNCFSRVLDHNGMIRSIINNYEYINFNFGPTLLSWLEKEDKEIYDLIIEADKKSIELHNGHGNAIAQVYNHMIMPLQSKRDNITQIKWGLRDFEYRFGRKSEGLWLAETAIDYNTVDLLIDFDIKYVILSPIQAKATRRIGDDTWIEIVDGSLNTRQPYKIKRDHGEIAVFYFDRDLSNGVSFEHLLQSADKFASRIINTATSEDDVVIVASDGEVFGHHEPFGDMCLSSLIENYHRTGRIHLYNCGEYLEMFPPEYETELWMGEDGKGSSWSCVHGVGRWYRDCGCQTGGEHHWNQKWRTPFREGLDKIRDKMDTIYETTLQKVINDPWALRDDYIEYILTGYDTENTDFIANHSNKKLTQAEILDILTLLESQKFAQFMYTSCAWFFTELTGIETVQNFKYAYKAVQLLGKEGEHLKPILEEQMEHAHSNIPEYKNGKWILNNWVYPYIQDFYHIVNDFVTLNKVCPNFAESNFKIFDTFEYKNLTSTPALKNNNSIHEGSIRIVDKKSHIIKDFLFIYKQKNKREYDIYICEKIEKEKYKKIKHALIDDTLDNESLPENIAKLTEKDLTGEIKKYIINCSYSAEIETMIDDSKKILSQIKEILSYYKEMEVNIPEVYKALVKFSSESIFFNLSRKLTTFPDRDILKKLLMIFDVINYFGIKVNVSELKQTFSQILYTNLLKVEDDLESNIYKHALVLIEFCNKIKLKLDRSRSENIVYKLVKSTIPKLVAMIDQEKDQDKKVGLMLQYRNLIILAVNFNINTEHEKKMFFEHLQFLDTSNLDSF